MPSPGTGALQRPARPRAAQEVDQRGFPSTSQATPHPAKQQKAHKSPPAPKKTNPARGNQDDHVTDERAQFEEEMRALAEGRGCRAKKCAGLIEGYKKELAKARSQVDEGEIRRVRAVGDMMKTLADRNADIADGVSLRSVELPAKA